VDADRFFSRLNPLMLAILRSPFHWVLSSGLMALTVTGRRSGRRYTIPVGYQKQGNRVTVLVSRAARKQWWRNYQLPAPVACRIRGRRLRGEGHVLPGASERFREAVDETFQRMPRLGGQFGIEYDRLHGLTDSQWQCVAETGAVVEIRLAAEAQAG